MKQKLYICKHCNNIISMIQDQGVNVFCCGEEMEEIIPSSNDASEEKHVPVYTVENNKVFVTIGSTPHPMNSDHYIEWVALETNQGVNYRYLTVDSEPKCCFSLCEGDKIEAVYAFCNQHSLWKSK